jgi:hypothetical protein
MFNNTSRGKSSIVKEAKTRILPRHRRRVKCVNSSTVLSRLCEVIDLMNEILIRCLVRVRKATKPTRRLRKN